ncbi:DUF1499 domain-containing protein [Marinomonas sp. TW1]|uniref:DUF1499 domain-containing protein n=1 Tax=Marinomonas sp. TW1 TaxID=1561203 RepID=UPI0007AF9357|nr:DUF1499 domain-containing protein [Marinomonas sp. TW1]
MAKLGIKNGQLTACSSKPNCVCSQAQDREHYIDPLLFHGNLETAHQALVTILQQTKRVNIVTIETNYLHAEFKIALLRFVDDVEFYFVEESSSLTTIHIRSASRVGYSDLGVNRKRMESLRAQL